MHQPKIQSPEEHRLWSIECDKVWIAEREAQTWGHLDGGAGGGGAGGGNRAGKSGGAGGVVFLMYLNIETPCCGGGGARWARPVAVVAARSLPQSRAHWAFVSLLLGDFTGPCL